MFARLTSVSIALIALIGVVAADDCQLETTCCLTSTIIHVSCGFVCC